MQRLFFWNLLAASLFCVACDDPQSGADEPLSDPAPEPAHALQPRVLDLAMPQVAYCDEVRDWDQARIDFERQVLELTNEVRARGADCGARGQFGPAPALVLNSALNCPARAHTLDMVEMGSISHSSSNGMNMAQRVDLVDYSWRALGENVAAGFESPAAVVQGWEESEGHCANMMNPSYTQLGVGYVPAPQDRFGHYWTQVFATGPALPPSLDEPSQTPAPAVGPLGLWALGMGVLSLVLFGWRGLAPRGGNEPLPGRQ